jgi:hypothetical protein
MLASVTETKVKWLAPYSLLFAEQIIAPNEAYEDCYDDDDDHRTKLLSDMRASK